MYIVFIILLCLYFVFLSSSNGLPSQASVAKVAEVKQAPPPMVVDTPPISRERREDPVLLELTNEVSSFEAAIKNCLGSYCFDETDLKNVVVRRIALLSPDTSISASLSASLSRFIHTGFLSALADQKLKDMEVVIDSHVPAYGYGKNHGYARIIRIVPNIPRQAYLLLLNSKAKEVAVSGALLYDLQVRSLLRWHFRLNHVAAHTAMLSVFVDDLVQRPEAVLDRILTFIGLRPGTEARLEIFKQLRTSLSSSPEAHMYKSLANIYKDIPANLLPVATAAIRDEMKAIYKWPTKTFNELQTMASGNSMSLAIDATLLAPDCKSDKVKCMVRLDQRESRVVD